MTDEVRNISVQVQATQAVNGLVKIGNALNELGGATGKTDAGLRKVDRTITKASNTIIESARKVANLKGELRTLSAENTKLSNSNGRLDARLKSLNIRIADQTLVIRNQKSIISSLSKQNLELARSYDQVGAAAARAANKTNSVKPAGGGGNVPPGGGIRGADAMGDLVPGNSSLNALRYSLYDVAATFGIVGAAATLAGRAVFKTGIEWDKNFANVVRTSQVTGVAVNWLKEEFLDLQSSIPVTSADLATIGTLGAQMGVAAANLSNFTEITAKFSATSGTSVDEAATALSRLDQLLPDVRGNYELLASTILKTGVNAVATEQQIIRGTNQIASISRIAGLTTPEVVALASAMSSLGFSPELQRSVITSSFSKILTATSAVTEKTEKFGAVLNITGKEFQRAWQDDAVGTYERLLKAIAGRGDAVTVLQDLGLASQRLTPNLLKLGQNTDVLDRALGDTASEWQTGTELTRQYGIIANTVAARIQVLSQTWEALLVTLDESDTIIKPLIEGLTGFLKLLRQIAKAPGVSTMVSIASAITVVAGVAALGAAGLAGLSAAYIAMQNVVATSTAVTVGNTVALDANSVARARQTLGLGAELPALTANTAAVGANSVALGGNAAAAGAAGTGILGFTGKMVGALPTILRFAGLIGLAVTALSGFATAIMTAPTWGHDLEKLVNGITTPQQTVVYDANKIKDATKAAIKYNDEVREAQRIYKDGGGLSGVKGPAYTGLGGALAAALESPNTEIKASTEDITEEVLALTTMEEKYAAVTQIAQIFGVSQQKLLSDVLPDLGTALGDAAGEMAELQDATERLESAQSLWAASLFTTDENLADLISGVQGAAGGFLNFGDALASAYEVDEETGENGGGLGAFLESMKSQIGGFESFYGQLGQLVQNGGVQLAGFFAEQGPTAAQALTDSLALTPDQIAEIENQMTLAAFYASEEFANTFAQNNSLLADVWRQSGNNPEAVAAFNTALADSMKGGAIDPAVLASLEKQFGVKLNIDMIPGIDKATFETQVALLGATVAPVRIPVETHAEVTADGRVYNTFSELADAWVVTMAGHKITLPVDPATAEGTALLAEWRANEYTIPVSLQSWVDTNGANAQLQALHDWWNNQTVTFKVATSYAYNSGSVGGIPTGPRSATGSLVTSNGLRRDNYPGYKNGAVLRGPGTGTSDSMLVRVSTGEAITRARAVSYYGPKMMEDINKLKFPKFANGGFPMGTPAGGRGSTGPSVQVEVNQYNPVTRDPLAQLREDSENLVAGLWG